MANNRMWLKNVKTGEQVLLAKYYPTTGWYTFHDDIGKRMDALFDADDHRSMWGNTDWRIEYEQEESPALGASNTGTGT